MQQNVVKWWLSAFVVLATSVTAVADVRVQDITRLQGQRTNKLMGYGLVVGLPGTGDGQSYIPTMRMLLRLHQRYHAGGLLTEAELAGNNSVAIVTVEAAIPEFGARSGQTLDVVVSTIGTAQSLQGGQLLMTPLQHARLDETDERTWTIFAWAGGRIELPDANVTTRGVIRGGATVEQDCFYGFILDGTITLVLDDEHAGWQWAHMLSRAVNHELSRPEDPSQRARGVGQVVVDSDFAVAIGPRSVTVRIPPWELPNPANFISRVLQTPLFMLPEQVARVTINRTTKNVSYTGAVTISPTVLQIPGVGTVLIGKPKQDEDGQATGEVAAADFKELFDVLSSIRVTPDQLIDAIEHLHRTGTLHAQLHYEQ